MTVKSKVAVWPPCFSRELFNQMKKTKTMTILYTLLAIFLALLLLFAIDRTRFWERIYGDLDLGPIDFSTLVKGKKPNEALVCPSGFCPAYDRPRPAPIFKSDASELIKELDQRISALEKVKRVDDASDPLRRRYVTYSPLMHFPDTMNIEAIDLEAVDGEPRSSVAVFAKARIGYSDNGANRARINQWLEMLDDLRVE